MDHGDRHETERPHQAKGPGAARPKRRLVPALLVLAAGGALLPGCRSVGSGAGTGALIGGLLGAGGGYAVGHHRGNRTNYTLAGAAAGAMAGYIVGDVVDDRSRATTHDPSTIDGSDRYVRRRRIVVDRDCEPCDPYPPGW